MTRNKYGLFVFYRLISLCFILLFNACATADDTLTIESLSANGLYATSSYTDIPDVPEFGAATIYYPRDKQELLDGVAVAPGFIEKQENMQWWGLFLASHGFAVLTLDTNELRDQPDVRARALIAAINILRNENTRAGSPLQGKIDANKMAVMGHSMGGGGTLLAANENSDQLRAAIALTPWLPNANFSDVSVPTLVIAGEADRVAPMAVHAWPHYQTLPTTIPRGYMEIKGGDHFIANTLIEGSRLSSKIDVHDLIGRLSLAWLKYYMDGDQRYKPFIFGELPNADGERLSRFEVHE